MSEQNYDLGIVYTNTYFGEPGSFVPSLAQELEENDSVEVHLDGENSSEEGKQLQEQFYDELLNGEIEIEGDRIEWSGGSWRDPHAAAVNETLLSYRDSIDRIDTGPVFDENILEHGYIPFKLEVEDGSGQENLPTGRIQGLKEVGRVEHVDENYASHLKETMNPEIPSIIVRDSVTAIKSYVENADDTIRVQEINERILPENLREIVELAGSKNWFRD